MNKEEIVKFSLVFSHDFDTYLREGYNNLFPEISEFYTFPIELQIGVFIKFLRENTIDIEIVDTALLSIEEAIIEGIKRYEDISGHYS